MVPATQHRLSKETQRPGFYAKFIMTGLEGNSKASLVLQLHVRPVHAGENMARKQLSFSLKTERPRGTYDVTVSAAVELGRDPIGWV